MKKIFFALMVLSFVFVSCKSSSGSMNGNKGMEQKEIKPMGMWKAMEWSSSDRIENKDGFVVVEVPAAKNFVELNCTNYNRFWISSVNKQGVDKNQQFSYKGEYYTIKCEGNVLSVSFDANKDSERSFSLTVQGGDIFSNIKFVQKAE